MDQSNSQPPRSTQQLSMSDDVQISAERQQTGSAMENVSPRASVTSETEIIDFKADKKPRQESFFEPERNSDPQWNANYSAPESTPKGRRPSSTASIAAGANSPEELLRRFSLVGRERKLSDVTEDPKNVHPNLHLSGNVISATFCVPYKIGYGSSGEWELKSRRGTSALYDSLSYLASRDSPWRHTLVGWTGEIDRLKEQQQGLPGAAASNSNPSPFNSASAPIPVQPQQSQGQQHEFTNLRIPHDDRKALELELERDHGGRVAPVWLWDEIDSDDTMAFRHQEKWRRYGEHELFTLFHYKQNMPTDGRATKKAWEYYTRMNVAFAEAIVNVYKPGDIVIVHDYQLLLLPSLLRQRIPQIYIGFFLHIPFPSSEYYRSLTKRKEILEGMLGANMIGFQAFSYSRHFSSCCIRILHFDASPAGVDAFGSHVAIDVFPIGINAATTVQSAFGHPEIEEKMTSLRELYAGKKIIVGRDRLDSVRGVAQKLQAYEKFLEKHPEWVGKVVLIQVTSPTSIEDRDETEKTERKIGEILTRIMGKFGSLGYEPVHYYPQYLSKEEYFALLRVADVGLITSVRDGMNTTALEYVICQRDHHGPLIISEFSGTAASLSDAIHINPWDLVGTAEAIHGALTMSDEDKAASHKALYKTVTRNTVQAWTNAYLKRLQSNLASTNHAASTPSFDRRKALDQYRKSSRRLFLFDYDGTLTPIVRDPEAATPTDRIIRTLKTLASDPHNSVWIISGRDQKFLDEWMGHISALGLSAEHGSFMRHPNDPHWENLTEHFDMSWQDKVMEIFEKITERTTGSFIERKKIALTWHYRRADPEQGKYQAFRCSRELEEKVVKRWDVEVMAGKANVEVRPRFVNKGEIVKRLVKECGDTEGAAPDFVLCLGDDFTDEDMFRSLLSSPTLNQDHVFAVTVGASNKATLARWHVTEPSEVIATITMLNRAFEPDSDELAVDGEAWRNLREVGRHVVGEMGGS